MALTTEQKVDLLLKKIGYTKTKTGSVFGTGSVSGTGKQPFGEAIPSPLVVANSSLWNEADSIPATPPASDTNQVKRYPTTSAIRMTLDTTVTPNRSFIAYATYNNTSSARLTNWIDTQFGPDYQIEVYVDDPTNSDNKLPEGGSGDDDGWYFDYSAGVLNFSDTRVPRGQGPGQSHSGVDTNGTNVYIVGYRYVGQTGAPTSGISTFSYLDLTVERNLDVGVQGGISTFRNNIDANGIIEGIAGENKIPFLYSNLAALPNAGTYHGMFAHVHSEGRGYFAHAGNWLELVNKDTSGNVGLSGDLDVDGHTELDNVNISGLTTAALLNVNNLTNGRVTYAGANGRLLDSANLTFNGSNLTVGGNLNAVDGVFSGNVSIGGTLTYEDVTNVDSVGLLTARSGIRVTGGVIEAQAGENKIPSLYANMAALPSASTYHGMFAHVHSTGRGYFAHAGNWLELVNKETNGIVGTGTETYNIGTLNVKDLDVDQHTNLDNVSISGITTFASTTQSTSTTTGAVQIAGGVGIQKNLNVGGHVDLTDSGRLLLGSGDDLQMYHNGSGNFLDVYTNSFQIRSGSNSAKLAEFKYFYSVDLYYNGTKRLATSNTGAVVTGEQLMIRGGTGDDAKLFFVADNSSSYSDHYRFIAKQSGGFALETEVNANTYENCITATQNGNVELYHNNSKKIETTSTGINVTGNVVSDGLVVDGNSDLNGNLDVAGTSVFNDDATFATQNGNNIQVDKSDNSLKVGDNIIAKFGDNSGNGDLWIYHDTGHSYVRRYGSGNLRLTASSGKIQFQKHGADTLADFNVDGSIDLYYDGTKRFETTGQGINVTGHSELDNVNIVGVTTHQGHVLPSADVTYDLGASSKQWRNLYADNIISAPGSGFIGPDLTVRNLKATGLSTFVGQSEFDGNVKFDSTIAVHDGTTGSNGQYLKSVGTGVTWASFPTLRTRQTFTASAGQTSFTFSYTVNFIDVFVNGIKLTDSEFTATNGTSVVLAVGCFVGDIVELVSYNTVSTGAGGGGGTLNNIVEDTTPQLGGNLDLFNKNITGTGNINITGNVTATNFIGNGSGLTGIVASGSGVIIKNSGSTVGTAGTINFGDNLSVSPASAGIVTITAGVTTSQFNVNKLHVSGITTFIGVTTHTDDVHFGGTNSEVWFWGNVNHDENYMAWKSWVAGGSGGLFIPSSSIYFGDSKTQFEPHGSPGGASSHFKIKQYSSASQLNPLRIESDYTYFTGSPGNTGRNIARFEYLEGASLYYTGTKRLQTSGIGITVTGTVVSTGATINGDLDVDGHTELDNVNIAGVVTAITFKGALEATSGTFSSNVNITRDLDVDGHTNLDNVNISGVATVGNLTVSGNSFQAVNGAFSNNITANRGTFGGNITGPLLDISPASGNDGIILLNSAGGQNNDFTRIRQAIADDSFIIENKASGSYQSFFKGNSDRGAELHFQGSKKLETLQKGVGIAGSITVSNDLSVTGVTTANTVTIKGPFGNNVIIGQSAGANWSGAQQCVAIGYYALQANTNSNFNTAVGVQALGALGSNSGSNYASNTAVGHLAGSQMTTSSGNTLIGRLAGSTINSNNNTILGIFDGNQGGLDIRNSSNNVVIADGASNIRLHINASGNAGIGTTNPDAAVLSSNTKSLAVGILTAYKLYGDGSSLTGISGSGGVAVQDEGSTLSTQASVLNFVGTGVVASGTGATKTITINTGAATTALTSGTSKLFINNNSSTNGYGSLEVVLTNNTYSGIGRTAFKIYQPAANTNFAEFFGESNQIYSLLDLKATYGGNTAQTIRFSTNNSNFNGRITHSTAAGQYNFYNRYNGTDYNPLRISNSIINTQADIYPLTNNTYDLGYQGTGVGAQTLWWRQLYVHNVKAGIVTATDVHVGAGVSAVGIITASSFRGDGSQLTGISGGTNVGITTNLSGTFTASAGSPSTINTFAYHDNDKVVEYTVYIKNGSNFQSQKVLAMRDGTTIDSTQFAVMFNSSLIVQCDATISSGNILLRATPESGVSGSTTYKVKREVM